MRPIEEALENFITELENTDEYKEYQAAKLELYKYPDLKHKVDDFRQRNFEMQQREMDSARLAEASDQFEQEYEDLNSDPKVHRFLVAELALVKLMQVVYGRITECLEFD